jgi:hypothetical protein
MSLLFNTWLRAQKDRHDSVVGDLARDMVQAGDWPRLEVPQYSTYVFYLENFHFAAPWAYRGLALAWEEFLFGKGEPTVAEIRATMRERRAEGSARLGPITANQTKRLRPAALRSPSGVAAANEI